MKLPDELPPLQRLEEDIRRAKGRGVPPPSPQLQDLRMLGRMGTGFGFAVLAGALGGMGLDRWFGTSPVLMLLGLALGTSAGGMTVYRVARAMEKDDGNVKEQDTKHE